MVQKVAENLLMEMHRQERFGFVQNPENSRFDPVFVLSSFLDPRYRRLLATTQKTSAKMLLFDEVQYTSHLFILQMQIFLKIYSANILLHFLISFLIY